MSRTEFLKKLITSLVIGKLPISVTKNFRKIYLLQCFVAGFRHYKGMELLTQMKEGDLLELVRETNNEFDDCAIALHWQGNKIGFIPASTNEMLSYLLDADALSLFAVITHLEKNTQPWENVAVAVYFIQEANHDLPAHANYLTRIEAPHYRTLSKKKETETVLLLPTIDNLFETSNRVINLDTIPEDFQEAKNDLEKWYGDKLISINKPGRYVQIATDDIYTYMYHITDKIETVVNDAGEKFLEFFLE